MWSQGSGFPAQPGCLRRTIRFWDLEKFQVVSCIEGEPGPVRYAGHWAVGSPSRGMRWMRVGFPSQLLLPPVPGSPQPPRFLGPMALSHLPRSILFNPDGCCLYSGCQDSLRVYGWEPERCFDVVLVNWGKVADLAICNNQLVRPPPAPTLPPPAQLLPQAQQDPLPPALRGSCPPIP